MSGQRAASAEIIGGFDDAFAEHDLPGAIDRYAGEQGILASDQPTRETKTIAWGVGWQWRQERGRVGSNLLAMGIVSATFQDVSGRSEERRVGKECRSRWWAYE